jgi:hypothetical protein
MLKNFRLDDIGREHFINKMGFMNQLPKEINRIFKDRFSLRKISVVWELSSDGKKVPLTGTMRRAGS